MLTFNSLCFFTLISIVLCEEPLLVDRLRWDFLELEEKMWKFITEEASLRSSSDVELMLVKNFFDFDQQLKQMPDDVLRGLDPIKTMPNFFLLYSELKTIENMYEKFRDYQNGQLSFNEINSLEKKRLKQTVMVDDMINDILYGRSRANETVQKIYNLTYVGREAFERQIHRMIEDNFWCKNINQSPQQIFYNLYNIVSLSDLKSYVMQQFAYLSSRIEEKANYTDLSTITRRNYELRVKKIITDMQIPLKYPKDIWRCDPETHIKGKTYEEFTRLLQGHIQNEVDMNHGKTCRENCAAYSYSRNYGCYDYTSNYCRKIEKCSGNIIGCRFVESHMSICISKSHSRRYDFIEYKSGRTMGKKHWCADSKYVKSWHRWFVHCSYCMCLCDEQGSKSDRYINIRPVLADVKNNRVVTGLRLVKHNRILHLQIQEGELLPYGYIDQSTVRWVPVDDYKITDRGVSNQKDYFMMTYPQRSMAMDEIQVNEENHVVTGVRFEFLKKEIHFEIYVSPFDWKNGTVLPKNSYYIYETNPVGRSKIDLSGSDIPTLSTRSEMKISDTNLYVEFTHTDFNKDAAQTTIPFIDLHEVFNTPAVPLMGAGIYYKGSKGYGGFIAPRIKTYDYGRHIRSEFPEMGDRTEKDYNVEIN